MKKLISLFLVAGFIIGTVPAMAINDRKALEKALLVIGYPVEVIEEMDYSHMLELVEMYNANPDNFELTVEYLTITEKGDVVPCLDISDKNMTFTQAVVSNNPDSGVSYTVAIDFNWNEYLAGEFQELNLKDRVVIAWGGDLFQYNKSAYVRYNYPGTGPRDWGDYAGQKYMTYKELTINAGGEYSFPMYYNSTSASPKYGSIMYTLTQTDDPKNRLTKALAVYARPYTTPLGTITVSASPSITIGSGYMESKQVESRISY